MVRRHNRSLRGVLEGMRCALLSTVLLALCGPGLCAQEVLPSDRVMDHLAVHGASRLAALAYVGYRSETPMIVKVGDLDAMQAPVDVDLHDVTAGAAGEHIMAGRLHVAIHNAGPLLVVSTVGLHDRVLTEQLGRFDFPGGDIVTLEMWLGMAIRGATNCSPMGYASAGPVMPATFTRASLADPTMIDVIQAVTPAHSPYLWVVLAKARPPGCSDAPTVSWEFGVYGFGSPSNGVKSSCQLPFRASSGPEILPYQPRWHAFPEPCGDVFPFRNYPPLF